MNYKEALTYTDSLKAHGMVPGLDSIKELCLRLGNPQDKLKFIHIAGTNGKGSVLAFLSSVYKNAGYRTGRYISPTLSAYRERIQINEKMITQKAFCEGLSLIREICGQMIEEGLAHPTAFEIDTALAFWYFAQKECDIIILETGMGGREDATNIIINTLAAVITPISMDHQSYLGSSLAAIAGEKAGIIKEGCMVISAGQHPEVMEVIRKAAAEKGCELIMVRDGDESNITDKNLHNKNLNNKNSKALNGKNLHYKLGKQQFNYKQMKRLEIGLNGKFQIENALLAIETVTAVSAAGYPVTEKDIRKGLLEARWPGRFMVLKNKPLFIVDGAHNEAAAARLSESIEYYFTNKRIIYIIGVLKDKEYGKIIQRTYSHADQIITVTPPDTPRALSAYELAQEAARVHPRVTAADSLEEAVEISYLLAGREDVIIAFGSLTYLGRLISIIEKKKE